MPSICAAIPLFINYSKGHSTWLHVGTLNLQARKAKIIGDVTSIPGWHRRNKYGLASFHNRPPISCAEMVTAETH